MSDLRAELARAFRDQARFAEGYSPLYAQLFAMVARWLAEDAADEIVAWLLQRAKVRRPFDVTLLLPAALHREVLAGEKAALSLSRFFPTAGGRVPAPPAPALDAALRHAILARGATLAEFIDRANVQTNETGRGLAWLLPVSALGWPSIHLLELGASAGLNLLADQRAYRLVSDAAPETTLLTLGHASASQFTTRVRNPIELPPLLCCPQVLSRTGGDVYPFHLNSAEDELTLMAFIWADQVTRVQRLMEGIAALRVAAASPSPVRLAPLRLPEELPRFLEEHAPRPLDVPLVLYNTTVSMYLPDGSEGLRQAIEAWAGRQPAPVLWLQWENGVGIGSSPPEDAWLAWTADLWPGTGRGRSHHWHLAWVHPHGTALEWTPQMDSFLNIAMHI